MRNFMKFKIFLSSTIREFENERKYVKTEIENDSVLNNFLKFSVLRRLQLLVKIRLNFTLMR